MFCHSLLSETEVNVWPSRSHDRVPASASPKHPNPMNHCTTTTTPLVVAIVLLAASHANAALLNIDVNAANPAPSPTQAGYYSLDVTDSSGTSISKTFTGVDTLVAPGGSVTLGISASTLFVTRDRASTPGDNPPFTLSNLYRDWMGCSGGPLAITLQGLAANSRYDVSFYSYDDANASNPVSNTDTFTNTTSGASSPSGSITYGLAGGGTVSANDQYKTTLSAISDSFGSLSFDESSVGPQGGPVLNGLEIVAVPEPAAALFGLVGIAGILRHRRGRMQSQ